MALDIGGRRIGVALAHPVARLAQPLTTLEATNGIMDEINKLVELHEVGHIVVGLPRNLQGQETDQTRTIIVFADQLKQAIPDIAISFQDEALTSRKAEQELAARGRKYEKADIDALAATYILEDYLRDNAAEAGNE